MDNLAPLDHIQHRSTLSNLLMHWNILLEVIHLSSSIRAMTIIVRGLFISQENRWHRDSIEIAAFDKHINIYLATKTSIMSLRIFVINLKALQIYYIAQVLIKYVSMINSFKGSTNQPPSLSYMTKIFNMNNPHSQGKPWSVAISLFKSCVRAVSF